MQWAWVRLRSGQNLGKDQTRTCVQVRHGVWFGFHWVWVGLGSGLDLGLGWACVQLRIRLVVGMGQAGRSGARIHLGLD